MDRAEKNTQICTVAQTKHLLLMTDFTQGLLRKPVWVNQGLMQLNIWVNQQLNTAMESNQINKLSCDAYDVIQCPQLNEWIWRQQAVGRFIHM